MVEACAAAIVVFVVFFVVVGSAFAGPQRGGVGAGVHTGEGVPEDQGRHSALYRGQPHR